jgi:hypothetical protein
MQGCPGVLNASAAVVRASPVLRHANAVVVRASLVVRHADPVVVRGESGGSCTRTRWSVTRVRWWCERVQWCVPRVGWWCERFRWWVTQCEGGARWNGCRCEQTGWWFTRVGIRLKANPVVGGRGHGGGGSRTRTSFRRIGWYFNAIPVYPRLRPPRGQVHRPGVVERSVRAGSEDAVAEKASEKPRGDSSGAFPFPRAPGRSTNGDYCGTSRYRKTSKLPLSRTASRNVVSSRSADGTWLIPEHYRVLGNKSMPAAPVPDSHSLCLGKPSTHRIRRVVITRTLRKNLHRLLCKPAATELRARCVYGEVVAPPQPVSVLRHRLRRMALEFAHIAPWKEAPKGQAQPSMCSSGTRGERLACHMIPGGFRLLDIYRELDLGVTRRARTSDASGVTHRMQQ